MDNISMDMMAAMVPGMDEVNDLLKGSKEGMVEFEREWAGNKLKQMLLEQEIPPNSIFTIIGAFDRLRDFCVEMLEESALTPSGAATACEMLAEIMGESAKIEKDVKAKVDAILNRDKEGEGE